MRKKEDDMRRAETRQPEMEIESIDPPKASGKRRENLLDAVHQAGQFGFGDIVIPNFLHD